MKSILHFTFAMYFMMGVIAYAKNQEDNDLHKIISSSVLMRHDEQSATLLMKHRSAIAKSQKLNEVRKQFLSQMCQFRCEQKKWTDASYWCQESYIKSQGKHNRKEIESLEKRAQVMFLEAYAMENVSPNLAAQKYRHIYELQFWMSSSYLKSLQGLIRLHATLY